MKIFSVLVFFFLFFFVTTPVFAAERYATMVIPIRGRQFWRTGSDISNLTILQDAIKNEQIPATWLLQYDSLKDEEIADSLKNMPNQETGIFLEVTYTLAKESQVNYPWESERWERGDKIFLSGYAVEDRKKLIDKVFEQYRQVFGSYPKSVGAWHIDSWSLQYIHKKYGVDVNLTCADQYLTDGYQIWGQVLGPYYPSIRNVLEPAAAPQDNLNVLTLQWAMRDPLLGYGTGSEISNHSTQVNDYLRSLQLDQDYFPHLVDEYFDSSLRPVSQMTLGIEVGEIEAKYLVELTRQIQLMKQKDVQFKTMADFATVFAKIYGEKNPSTEVKGTHGEDSLTWYSGPLYRLGVLSDPQHTYIVDLRVYNTTRLWDTEYWFKDSRQNLLRLVPGVIDKIGLHNQVEIIPQSYQIEESAISFNVVDLAAAKEVFKDCPCSVSYNLDKVTLRFYRNDAWLFQPGQLVSSISYVLEHLVPDIRISKIAGKTVAGILMNKETLLGFDLSRNDFGMLHFDYPVLDAFKNNREALQLNQLEFGQSDEQIAKYKLRQQDVKLKDAKYGIDNLKKLYETVPTYENSRYGVY